jgi:hypothetical protein
VDVGFFACCGAERELEEEELAEEEGLVCRRRPSEVIRVTGI